MSAEHEHTWVAHVERCATCGSLRSAVPDGPVAVSTEDIAEGRVILVSPAAAPPYEEPGAPSCQDPRGHAWELLRRTLAHTIEACGRCSSKRYRTAEGSWAYGEPPAPPAARRMKEGEALEEGETWQDADGYVPREISTPQPRGERIVNGRRVYSE